MFDAQYKVIRDVYKTVQDTFHPRITFLFTGNTSCESITDKIDFNQPLFESYHNIVGFKELERYVWGYRNDGIPHAITLFQNNDGSYFLELECPGQGISNRGHAIAILNVLRRNNVI